MIAWLLVITGLAGFSEVGAGATLPPETLGQGVTVSPVEGWTSAQNEWDVGAGGISLKRSGALVGFAADAWTGTAQELLDDQLAGVKDQFGSFRSLPVVDTTVAGGAPALKVLFYGVADSGNLEGEMVVTVTGKIGVVMMAMAPDGQMTRVQSDLDTMLDSLVIPQ
jgi:hypothetical protein